MVSPFIITPIALIIAGIIGSVHDLKEQRADSNDDSYFVGFDNGYYEGFDDGYCVGFDDGYSDGIAEAQCDIASYVDDFSSLSWDILEEYGMNPYEAVEILSNYADVPDEVNKEDVNIAIWAIYSYYIGSEEIISSIERYCID